MFKTLFIAIAALCSFSGCTSINGWFSSYTPAKVQADTAGVVSATRLVVLAGGPVAEATLNTYILAIHGFLVTTAASIKTGQSVLPTPAQIQAQLAALAKTVGNPIWAQNMAGNLVTTYTRFYNNIGTKDASTVFAYVSAFAAGTV